MSEMRKTECISGLSGSNQGVWCKFETVIDFLPSNQNETRLQFVMKIRNGEEGGSFF